MAAAPPLEFQYYVAIRTNRVSNTVTIETYDAQHAKSLLQLTSIRISPNQTIPITVHQTPGKGIRPVGDGGVPEKSHHIIAARLMGKRGACPVTFEGTRPPRTIGVNILRELPRLRTRKCHALATARGLCARFEIFISKRLLCLRAVLAFLARFSVQEYECGRIAFGLGRSVFRP
ncbi:hypothetical protein HPB48_022748 [Haemaphysalis longicornis]|uniref:Uncharacterized protein n=1 Tax=Haemaphysalis longicornis TaxID=44386 RepID=A0A9J6FPP0_HAELO|nr:hypothetical protein HPB48_022748 [Haemaphysalis longicornis]